MQAINFCLFELDRYCTIARLNAIVMNACGAQLRVGRATWPAIEGNPNEIRYPPRLR